MPATLTLTRAALPHQSATRPAAAGHLARVTICDTLEAAAAAWQALESDSDLFTPYQRYGLLAAWYRHIGSKEGARAYILVGTDAGDQPLVVMPLVVERKAGIRVASFFGGKHVSFSMPLWRRDFAASATPADLDRLLDALRETNTADMLALTRQPLSWGEPGAPTANPMAMLPHQPSINDCPRLMLSDDAAPDAGVSSSMRKRLRKKEAKLKNLPGYRYTRATTQADANRILEAFFEIKPKRMAAAGLPDVFSGDDVKSFLREACLADIAQRPSIELHAIECDDEIIAMFSAVVNGARVSTMFNTYTMSENAHYSPGLILLRNMLDHYVAHGHRAIDFGIGEGEYKRIFCKDDEPLFDSYIGLNARGHVVALAMAAMARAKRTVKSRPALKRAVIAIRARLARRP